MYCTCLRNSILTRLNYIFSAMYNSIDFAFKKIFLLLTSLAIWSSAWSSALLRELPRRRPTAPGLSMMANISIDDGRKQYCNAKTYWYMITGKWLVLNFFFCEMVAVVTRAVFLVWQCNPCVFFFDENDNQFWLFLWICVSRFHK